MDMEEGVVSEMMQGPLGEVFDCRQLLTDVSGSGNNWYLKNSFPFVHLSIIVKKNQHFGILGSKIIDQGWGTSDPRAM